MWSWQKIKLAAELIGVSKETRKKWQTRRNVPMRRRDDIIRTATEGNVTEAKIRSLEKFLETDQWRQDERV